MAKLYILCGPSGSGKSTWAKNFVKDHNDVWYVSRDAIRLDMLKDDEPNFAHEKEVFRIFVKKIATIIMDNHNCIADATHLNEFSRRKLTQALDMYTKDYEIVCVVFNTDINTCLDRNAEREGRACVPESAIRRMFRDFKHPTLDEDERIVEVLDYEL